MARARKCDICGELYESYNTVKNETKPNSFKLLNTDDSDQHWTHPRTDACPTCMGKIMNLIKAIKEESKNGKLH